MTVTLIIDPSGSIALPTAFLEKFQLKPGARLVADLSEDGIELRPDDAPADARASLVTRDGLLVFAGTEPFDAVQVIMAARADREDSLSSRVTR